MYSGSKFGLFVKIILAIAFAICLIKSCIKLSKNEVGTKTYVENIHLDFPAVTVCPQMGGWGQKLITLYSNFTLEDLYSIPNPKDFVTTNYESFRPFFSR